MSPPSVKPAWYRPYLDGVYSVRPGLHPHGKDFGNGDADKQFFQIDDERPRYLKNKRAITESDPEKVTGRKDLSPRAARAALEFVANAVPTGDSVVLPGMGAPIQQVIEAMMTLSSRVQEDLVLVECPSDGADHISWLHVAAPNMWTPGKALGKSYTEVHGVVPGMESALKAGTKILRTVTGGQRYVRFVWGLVSDDRLTRLPGTYELDVFSDTLDEIYVRVERQLLIGLPGVDAVLFTIRTYVRAAAALPQEDRHAIARAIRGMTPESRAYKGIATSYERLANLLEA